MVQAILETLRNTWTGYVDAMRLVIPRVLAMASVIAAGWVIAAAVRALVARALGWLRLGRLAERTGAAELLRKAELPPAERLAASVVFWLLFLGFLLAGFDALGFETLETLRGEVSRLVPRLVASFAILGTGLVLANLAWRVVLLAAVNAGWPSARLTSGAVHALLVTVVVAMTLDQLGVARAIVLAAFAIAFGALMLALAIAFGIGAGPIVRRILEERLAARGQPRADGSSHL